MKTHYGFLFIFLTLALGLKTAVPAACAEFREGQLKLVIHERTGRFSLYDLGSGNPQALFSDKDPRTSFLSVMVNDIIYKMGDTSIFRIRLEKDSPSLIFESPFMKVTKDFIFVRNHSGEEGLQISITLESKGRRRVSAGARYLIDTSLGEGPRLVPIRTDQRTISAETIITRYDSDDFWIDGNDGLSLTGSLYTGAEEDPDSVHFANWKKLADVTWKAPYQRGRNFSAPPYSVRDTAVCYYFEPRNLGAGERRTFSFTLSRSQEGLFGAPQIASAVSISPVPENIPVQIHVSEHPDIGNEVIGQGDNREADTRDQDLALLRSLISQIDTHMLNGTGTDEELQELELAVDALRSKYGLGSR